MSADHWQVLALIRRSGPIGAKAIASALRMEEKQARSCIDKLRANGEPVWHDPATGGFWWRNDMRPGNVAHARWKRDFPGGLESQLTAEQFPEIAKLTEVSSVDQMSSIISPDNWRAVVEANRKAVRLGWAAEGVFAPAIGPEFEIGGRRSILYVGKSAGPLGSRVGSEYDLAQSTMASLNWMLSRQNNSQFWQLAEQFDPARRSLAWSNVCKMDRVGGDEPPSPKQWNSIAECCEAVLAEEIEKLKPKLALFAISNHYRTNVKEVLSKLGYKSRPLGFDDGLTELFARPDETYAILTKHPQGWGIEERDRMVQFAKSLLG